MANSHVFSHVLYVCVVTWLLWHRHTHSIYLIPNNKDKVIPLQKEAAMFEGDFLLMVRQTKWGIREIFDRMSQKEDMPNLKNKTAVQMERGRRLYKKRLKRENHHRWRQNEPDREWERARRLEHILKVSYKAKESNSLRSREKPVWISQCGEQLEPE